MHPDQQLTRAPLAFCSLLCGVSGFLSASCVMILFYYVCARVLDLLPATSAWYLISFLQYWAQSPNLRRCRSSHGVINSQLSSVSPKLTFPNPLEQDSPSAACTHLHFHWYRHGVPVGRSCRRALGTLPRAARERMCSDAVGHAAHHELHYRKGACVVQDRLVAFVFASGEQSAPQSGLHVWIVSICVWAVPSVRISGMEVW